MGHNFGGTILRLNQMQHTSFFFAVQISFSTFNFTSTEPLATPCIFTSFNIDLSASMPSLSEGVSLPPAAPDPHSCHLRGSFEHDIHTGGYDLRWSNMEEFESWKLSEEEASTIEFLCKEKVPPIGDAAHLWKKKLIFICAHGFTGGKDNYTKKTSHECKLPAKRVGCPCRLTIKLYPHTNEVLGSYHKSHSHEIVHTLRIFERKHVLKSNAFYALELSPIKW